MFELLKGINNSLIKSLAKINSEKLKKEIREQQGIEIFSDALFWKSVQQNKGVGEGQLITLKEFHRRYESTLAADMAFLDLKRCFSLLRDYTEKIRIIRKNAKAKVLIQYKKEMKGAILLRDSLITKIAFGPNILAERKRRIEGNMEAGRGKCLKQGIPPESLDLVDRILEMETKLVPLLNAIHVRNFNYDGTMVKIFAQGVFF